MSFCLGSLTSLTWAGHLSPQATCIWMLCERTSKRQRNESLQPSISRPRSLAAYLPLLEGALVRRRRPSWGQAASKDAGVLCRSAAVGGGVPAPYGQNAASGNNVRYFWGNVKGRVCLEKRREGAGGMQSQPESGQDLRWE